MFFDSKWTKFNRNRRRQVRRIKILSRHPFAVPFITGFCLISIIGILLIIFGNAKVIQVTPNSKIVIVSHDGIKQIVPSDDRTVGALLKRLDVQIHTGDVVAPSLNTPINQDDFRINIYRALPVEITKDGTTQFTYSAAKTPRAIAQQAGATVYPADYVTAVPTENFLQADSIGEQVVINPATPVNLNLYGSEVLVRTHAQTVGDLMKQEKVHLSSADQVFPGEGTPLTPYALVFVSQKGVQIKTTIETIPNQVQINYVSDLAYGTSSIVQQGSAGQETVIYEVNAQTGAASGSPLQTVVTIPPVTEIVDEGDSLSGIQGDMALAGISPPDYTYVDYIVSHESGWCTTKWQGDIGYCPATFTQQYANDAEIGYGLCQSTPPDKMSTFGADWQTDPITQLKWCNGYADSKYGSWYSAYIHWTNYGSW